VAQAVVIAAAARDGSQVGVRQRVMADQLTLLGRRIEQLRNLGLSVICVQKVPLRKAPKINVLCHGPSANQLKYRQIKLFAVSPAFCPSNERFPDGRIIVR
jgi:hypothetical protein